MVPGRKSSRVEPLVTSTAESSMAPKFGRSAATVAPRSVL
jgi:hypothetical protein